MLLILQVQSNSSLASNTDLARAQKLLDTQHAAAARPILERLVQSEPRNAQAWFMLGTVRQDLDIISRLDKSPKECYLMAVKLDPGFGRAYAKLGELAGIEGDFKEEIRLSTVALTCKMPDPLAYRNRAIAHSNLHEDKLALEDFDRFIASGVPMIPTKTLQLKSALQENAGKFDDAVKTLHELQKLDPGMTFRLQEAKCLSKAGKNDEALKVFDAIIKARPAEETALLERARLLVKMQRFEAAAKAYDKVIDAEPSARSYKERAMVWDKLKQPAKAKADRDKAESFDI